MPTCLFEFPRIFVSLFRPHLHSTDLPQNKNKFMTHISGFFNGTKFRCAHMGYMRFPKRTKNVTDRFLSRFWVFFHFKSSKTTRYWVFYDKIILNLRVSFLFIGKSVLPITVRCICRELELESCSWRRLGSRNVEHWFVTSSCTVKSLDALACASCEFNDKSI